MATIRVYEPALCCSTGVCGPDLDQDLVTFTADVKALQEEGVDVQRANLASEPAVFASEPAVVAFLQTAGSEGLPLTLVDGVTVLTGRRPTRTEMQRWAGIAPEETHTRNLPMAGGCCGGSTAGESSSGCC